MMLNEREQITMYDVLQHEWTRFLVLSVMVLGFYACAGPVDKPAQEEERITPPPDEPVLQPTVTAPVAPPPTEPTDQPTVAEPPPPPQEPAAEPEPTEAAPAVRRYRIDPKASDIKIFVYRTGHAARVGHDHVITGKSFTGTVVLTENVIDSTVDLSIPVKSLLVDDPKAREASGPDFSEHPTEEDRAAILRNMLSDSILNAERYDAVTLHARVVDRKSPAWQLDVDITIRGVTKRVRTLMTLEKARERIVASGTLQILQSDFGIRPFSVLAGALQVKDEVKLQYRLVAHHVE